MMGESLGNYRIVSKIGQGGMGVISGGSRPTRFSARP